MQGRSSAGRWLWLAIAATIVAAAALVARDQLASWTRSSLRQQYAARIAALPEPQAAELVRQLGELGAETPAVLVPVLADRREAVARVAEQTLAGLIDQWRTLPPEESSPPVARLAHELALVAPTLPDHQRRAAHHLAARLLVCPLDQHCGQAAHVVADCESVLRLDLPPASEIRVASAPLPLVSEPPPLAAPPPTLIPQSPVEIPATPAPPAGQVAPVEPKFYGTPREPEHLIDASRERPEEPRQLRRPRATKIEG